MELYALYVDPDFWGRRVGRTLVNQAIFDAALLDQRGIGLWCIKGNDRARRFYDSAGFKLGGRERTTHELTGMPLTEVEYLINFVAPHGGTA